MMRPMSHALSGPELNQNESGFITAASKSAPPSVLAESKSFIREESSVWSCVKGLETMEENEGM